MLHHALSFVRQRQLLIIPPRPQLRHKAVVCCNASLCQLLLPVLEQVLCKVLWVQVPHLLMSPWHPFPPFALPHPR